MRVTDLQVRRLREEMSKSGQVGLSALRAGMHRNTARRWLELDCLPSETLVPRTWRTREDPFEQDWPGLAVRLEDAPTLEAKALFLDLLEHHPDRYDIGQLRTFQRRVREWRARHGPPKEVFFPQQHIPGEAAQTDFTHADELGITIAEVPFPHLLCHAVLPYSDWSWATPCRSESLAALREGVQAALWRLGRVPEWHQTDNSTSATHSLATGKRDFNEDYVKLVEHYGMKPRTIAVGEKHQNGDVEAHNGALKRHLEQVLLLRGSRDFADRDAYVAWLEKTLEKRNRLREKRLREELAVMQALPVHRLPAYSVVKLRVGQGSTIRVKRNIYSVPSRLCGEPVRVHVYDDRIEVFHGTEQQMAVPRLAGSSRHRIQYRHVIDALLRKPGAFRHYRYLDDLFPTSVFREAFDVLDAGVSRWQADVNYLRILRLAARTMETDVEKALREVLQAGELPLFERIEARVAPPEPSVPDLEMPVVELAPYDELLGSTTREEIR